MKAADLYEALRHKRSLQVSNRTDLDEGLVHWRLAEDAVADLEGFRMETPEERKRGIGRWGFTSKARYLVLDYIPRTAPHRPDDFVCTTPPRSADVVGQACGDCGHSNVLHPHHFGNPALTECLICRLEVTISGA